MPHFFMEYGGVCVALRLRCVYVAFTLHLRCVCGGVVELTDVMIGMNSVTVLY